MFEYFFNNTSLIFKVELGYLVAVIIPLNIKLLRFILIKLSMTLVMQIIVFKRFHVSLKYLIILVLLLNDYL